MFSEVLFAHQLKTAFTIDMFRQATTKKKFAYPDMFLKVWTAKQHIKSFFSKSDSIHILEVDWFACSLNKKKSLKIRNQYVKCVIRECHHCFGQSFFGPSKTFLFYFFIFGCWNFDASLPVNILWALFKKHDLKAQNIQTRVFSSFGL